MKQSVQHLKLAKVIARLVLEKGETGEAELPAILERVLRGKPSSEQKRFLRLLHTVFQREIHKDTLTIEYVGTLEDSVVESLKAKFSSSLSRPIRVVKKENPSLIGGLRVQLGDSVYDSSISGKLAALAARVN